MGSSLMISVFIQEQKRYTQKDLMGIFQVSADKIVNIIRILKEFDILKIVKITDIQKNMSDLLMEDIEVASVEVGGNEQLYVFTFVGVVIVNGIVLKCYPKYIVTNKTPKKEMKKILRVLQKYNAKEQIVRMYNDGYDSKLSNFLAIMLYLLNDYYENGAYINEKETIEINGTGEIQWEKTINESFAILGNNKPYYTELKTKKRIIDNYDYIKRLHECILRLCSQELKNADLLYLFDITPINISDETLDDFGEKDFILYRIENELSVQFSTRKQLLLKTMYAFINGDNGLNDIDCFNSFGTNNFNLVWEKVCSEIFDNQLQKQLGALNLPVILLNEYDSKKALISVIEKVQWIGYKQDGSKFQREANDTLRPDIVTMFVKNNVHSFIILDAKYYNLRLIPNEKLSGQPGINDITKQYLYELAFKKFINDHKIENIKNCFLIPTDEETLLDYGYVKMNMFELLNLQNISLWKLPADEMFTYYLDNKKIDILAFLENIKVEKQKTVLQD